MSPDAPKEGLKTKYLRDCGRKDEVRNVEMSASLVSSKHRIEGRVASIAAFMSSLSYSVPLVHTHSNIQKKL
jgi:hypothetical protein